jgi:hypothetical protein
MEGQTPQVQEQVQHIPANDQQAIVEQPAQSAPSQMNV